MATHRTLQYAVTGSLLALAPVGPVDSCSPILADPPMDELSDVSVDEPGTRHPDHDPISATDRIRARDGGPVVNPGPVPSGE